MRSSRHDPEMEIQKDTVFGHKVVVHTYVEGERYQRTIDMDDDLNKLKRQYPHAKVCGGG